MGKITAHMEVHEDFSGAQQGWSFYHKALKNKWWYVLHFFVFASKDVMNGLFLFIYVSNMFKAGAEVL